MVLSIVFGSADCLISVEACKSTATLVLLALLLVPDSQPPVVWLDPDKTCQQKSDIELVVGNIPDRVTSISAPPVACCWVSVLGLPGTSPPSTRKPCRVIDGSRMVELTLTSSGGDLLTLGAPEADGIGDCVGSLVNDCGSGRGVVMKAGAL